MGKREKLVNDGGTGPGLPPTLDHDQAQLLTDVIRRAGRDNKPKSLTQIADTVQQLDPKLSRQSARDAYNTVKKRHSDVSADRYRGSTGNNHQTVCNYNPTANQVAHSA